MLPANPQTHNLSPSSNRGMGSAINSGQSAAATGPANTTRSNARPSSPIATGTQGGATPQFSENGPPSSPPTGGDPGSGGSGGGGGGSGGGSGGGCGIFIATSVNPLFRVAPNPCNPGGGGGGPTPCYANGQGGTPCVAMRQPTKGAVCDGSPTEIGDQYPGTTTTYADEIVNIFPVFANNQTGNEDVVAWEYTMGAGNMYIQGNQAFQGFWQNFAAGAFGPAAAFESGGISGMNSDQASQVNSYAASHHGYVGTTACFSNNLPPAQT